MTGEDSDRTVTGQDRKISRTVDRQGRGHDMTVYRKGQSTV